jgi:methylmalonyl-CoA mutase
MGNSLFSDFPSVSEKEWKNKIQLDLHGKDYNKTLITRLNEGISVKPFYHADNFKQIAIPNTPSSYEICQTIFINDEIKAAKLANEALRHGASAIRFIALQAFEIGRLFKKIDSHSHKKGMDIYFQLHFLDEEFLNQLAKENRGWNLFLNVDIIGNLVKTGNWFKDNKQDHQLLFSILKKEEKNISVISIDVSHYQNSGANIVQQIAYALAHANEYLNYFGEALGAQINFNFSIGPNYFLEIAKLRAIRYLWDLLLDAYDLKIKANIFVEPSLRNKSLFDYNSNMLRTTTECLSAVLGGANTISNTAYDTIFHRKNEFGERIARNQLIILKDESNLKNASFVDGSYYLEELTCEIAEKALDLFKNIEKSGGFVKQLFDGTIQRKILESADKEQEQFDSDSLVILGANKYKKEGDPMKEQIELYPFLKTQNKETVIEPIIAKRLAEKIEKERLNNEKN